VSTRFRGQSWTVSFGMVKGSVRAPRNSGGSWAYRIDLPAVRGQARRQVQVGGFASETDARSALDEALAEYEDDRPVRRAPDTVGGFLLDRWLRSIRREVADSALSNYSTIVATYVVPRIGDVRLSRLSTRQVDQLYVDLLENGTRDGRPLSATTVGQVHRTLRRAFNDAVRWGLINANPVTAAKVPRPTPRMLSIWTPEQSTSFLESVRSDRLFALWLVALHTGMRRGELAGLRWRDVDLVSGKVSVVLQRTTDTIQTEAAEALHRVMSPPAADGAGPNPVIGESLEEAPKALRAAARPFVARKRKHRRPSAADDKFVTAIAEA
jgi:integrase